MPCWRVSDGRMSLDKMDDPGIPVQGVIFTLRTRGWERAGWAESLGKTIPEGGQSVTRRPGRREELAGHAGSGKAVSREICNMLGGEERDCVRKFPTPGLLAGL